MKSRLLLAILLSFASVMCCYMNVDAGSKEDYIKEYKVLENRFYDYMSHRKLGEFEELYQMLNPETQKKYTYDEFLRLPTETRTIVTYNLNVVDVQDDKAMVYFNELAMGGGVPAPQLKADQIQEWVKIEGVWYLDLNTDFESLVGSGCGGRKKETDTGTEIIGCGNRKIEPNKPGQRNDSKSCGK